MNNAFCHAWGDVGKMFTSDESHHQWQNIFIHDNPYIFISNTLFMPLTYKPTENNDRSFI